MTVNYTELANELIQSLIESRIGKEPALSEKIGGETLLLYYLLEKGEAAPSDLAWAMGVTSARVAAALNDLESKELIKRKIDTNDRRKIIVSLTNKGINTTKTTMSMFVERFSSLLQKLGEDDAKEYIRITKKMSELVFK
ncbi:MAG: MarR family transcriptional regulator [Firmicutes bacterium]|nr:MarR family transcriptional regulator [Bacillota bacterium]